MSKPTVIERIAALESKASGAPNSELLARVVSVENDVKHLRMWPSERLAEIASEVLEQIDLGTLAQNVAEALDVNALAESVSDSIEWGDKVAEAIGGLNLEDHICMTDLASSLDGYVDWSDKVEEALGSIELEDHIDLPSLAQRVREEIEDEPAPSMDAFQSLSARVAAMETERLEKRKAEAPVEVNAPYMDLDSRVGSIAVQVERMEKTSRADYVYLTGVLDGLEAKIISQNDQIAYLISEKNALNGQVNHLFRTVAYLESVIGKPDSQE